jgi:putative acetyltransferase
LVTVGLEECRRHGYSAVVVVGHPEYYPRFGFVPGDSKGLTCEFTVPRETFMALRLEAGALAQGGLVRYHQAFQMFGG